MSIKAALQKLAPQSISDDVPGAPAAELTLAPETLADAARTLEFASSQGMAVLVWGGGNHAGIGYRVEPDLVLSTAALNRWVDWQPEDLTLVVEAGVTLGEIEERLESGKQTAGLAESVPSATIGGVVAAGISGYRRARYGAVRERMLEVELVTGDGRHIKGGGRVVKNVTGFDIPKLATGSLGSLGLIGQVCLKLWPQPPVAVTVSVDDPLRAAATAFRPLAVLETRSSTAVYLGGQQAEVEAQTAALGGSAVPGLDWPELPDAAVRLSLRVPPALTEEAVGRLPAEWAYVAQHGVGVVECTAPSLEDAQALREWAESQGGALVLLAAPDTAYETFDPWGTPPNSLDIQRRLVEKFDPARVLNPGRLPGRI